MMQQGGTGADTTHVRERGRVGCVAGDVASRTQQLLRKCVNSESGERTTADTQRPVAATG